MSRASNRHDGASEAEDFDSMDIYSALNGQQYRYLLTTLGKEEVSKTLKTEVYSGFR